MSREMFAEIKMHSHKAQ